MLSLRHFTIVLFMAMVLEVLLSMLPECGYAQQDIPEIVKISSEADRAVIRNDEGRLRVIRPGDRITPYGKVLAISKQRIVLKNEKAEIVIINIENGKQSIQRVGKINKAASVPRIQISTEDEKQYGRQKNGVANDLRKMTNK